MYRIAVIGDPDSVLGFKALGLEVCPALRWSPPARPCPWSWAPAREHQDDPGHIQRPLEAHHGRSERAAQHFTPGIEVPALDREKKWAFTPAVQPGTRVVATGDAASIQVQETSSILHKIMVPPVPGAP